MIPGCAFRREAAALDVDERILSSGAISPARAPASMLMLQASCGLP